jgi:hypothetical protein
MNSRRDFLTRALALSLGAAAGASFTPDATSAVVDRASAGGANGKPLDPEANRERISLPAPDRQGGMPLMQALAERKSTRKFASSDLEVRHTSNILWAAVGMNRRDGKRTIPTAFNRQNIIVYAAMGIGVWRYLPEKHALERESREDLCRKLGGAPLTLGFAAQGKFAAMHAGSAYQNVGLYCASAGLANVVKVTGVREFKAALELPEDYELLIVQSIGLPG